MTVAQRHGSRWVMTRLSPARRASAKLPRFPIHLHRFPFMNRFRFLPLILLTTLMLGRPVRAAEALLIPEVITREISIHVGGLQTPEIQHVETREVSLFIGTEPVPPYRQVESREVSLVVSDASPPPRMEQVEVTLSPPGMW